MTELEELSLADIVHWAGDALNWLFHAPLSELFLWAGGIVLALLVLTILAAVAAAFGERRFQRERERERNPRRRTGAPEPRSSGSEPPDHSEQSAKGS